MKLAEALKDAQKYAETIKGTTYVHTRGNEFKSSRLSAIPGWRVKAICVPGSPVDASEVESAMQEYERTAISQ